MAIQWFPGHMHRARKQIAEAMPQTDLVIEVLDARLPYSSENPLIPGLLNNISDDRQKQYLRAHPHEFRSFPVQENPQHPRKWW